MLHVRVRVWRLGTDEADGQTGRRAGSRWPRMTQLSSDLKICHEMTMRMSVLALVS